LSGIEAGQLLRFRRRVQELDERLGAQNACYVRLQSGGSAERHLRDLGLIGVGSPRFADHNHWFPESGLGRFSSMRGRHRIQGSDFAEVPAQGDHGLFIRRASDSLTVGIHGIPAGRAALYDREDVEDYVKKNPQML